MEGWKHKVDSVTGAMKYTLTDDDGEIISTFSVLPADVRTGSRFMEVSEWFSKMADSAPENATVEEAREFNDVLEDKLCYVLGEKARVGLFAVLPATYLTPRGNLFATEVFEVLSETIGPEIKARHAKTMEAASKYTAKYVPAIPDEVIDAAVKQAGALKY